MAEAVVPADVNRTMDAIGLRDVSRSQNERSKNARIPGALRCASWEDCGRNDGDDVFLRYVRLHNWHLHCSQVFDGHKRPCRHDLR